MAAIDDFVSGLIEIEPEVPQFFTWNAVQYPCFASGTTRGGKLEQFGWGVDDDLMIVVRGALFGDNGPFPQKEQTLFFRGISYRIENVQNAQADSAGDSAFLRLKCVNASRGA